MVSLTANDLKTRGVAAIEESLAGRPEAVISVRGKERFVVMEVAQYQYLRECEVDAALAQSRSDVAGGHYVVESAQEHVDRLHALLEPPTAPVRDAPVKKAAARRTSTAGKQAGKRGRRSASR